MESNKVNEQCNFKEPALLGNLYFYPTSYVNHVSDMVKH